MARAADIRRPDLDDRLEHIHHATTVRRFGSELYVLAFDHRRQLEQLADESGAPRTDIARFKELIADGGRAGGRTITSDRERLGVIVDARHGSPVLEPPDARRICGSDVPSKCPASRPLGVRSGR